MSREPNLGVGGRQGLPGDGVGRGIVTLSVSSLGPGAPSRLFAYLQRRSLEDWAPTRALASYVPTPGVSETPTPSKLKTVSKRLALTSLPTILRPTATLPTLCGLPSRLRICSPVNVACVCVCVCCYSLVLDARSCDCSEDADQPARLPTSLRC